MKIPPDRRARPPADRRPVLVVGATGQLGCRVVHRLAEAGRPVRAFVRPGGHHALVRRKGVDLVVGDLGDPASVAAACAGARAIVATANGLVPERGASFASVEERGYGVLLEAAKQAGVGRFVFCSVPVTPHDARVPLFRAKRSVEARLTDSGLEHCIVRPGPFMDDWFALIGSRLPLRGDPASVLRRPWGFLQTFQRAVGDLIERRGLAVVPGDENTAHAFIAVEDVAAFLIATIDHPEARNRALDLAGPQRLSWGDVASLYGEVLGRPVRVQGTPPWVFRLQLALMRPFSPSAASVMGLNWLAAVGMPLNDPGHLEAFRVRRTLARDFLRSKAALPAETP